MEFFDDDFVDCVVGCGVQPMMQGGVQENEAGCGVQPMMHGGGRLGEEDLFDCDESSQRFGLERSSRLSADDLFELATPMKSSRAASDELMELTPEKALLAKFEKVEQAWSHTVLRKRDCLEPVNGVVEEHGRRNVFQLRGFITMGFSEIGRGRVAAKGETDINDARRHLEALMKVAGMVKTSFLSCSKRLNDRFFATPDDNSALCVNRYSDATPMLLRFGRLAGELQSHARYLHLGTDENGRPRWTTSTFEEHRRQHPRSLCSMGVLEVLATSQDLVEASVSSDNVYNEQRQKFIQAPCFVSRTNASTLYEAVDVADASWSHAKLIALADLVGLLIVSDVPDNCGAVKRMKKKIAQLFKDCPKLLYDEFAGCACHKLHNIIVKVSGEATMIGDIHAVAYVLSIAMRRNQLWKAAFELVHDELLVFDGVEPNPEQVGFNKDLIENLLLRSELLRARWDAEGT